MLQYENDKLTRLAPESSGSLYTRLSLLPLTPFHGAYEAAGYFPLVSIVLAEYSVHTNGEA